MSNLGLGKRRFEKPVARDKMVCLVVCLLSQYGQGVYRFARVLLAGSPALLCTLCARQSTLEVKRRLAPAGGAGWRLRFDLCGGELN